MESETQDLIHRPSVASDEPEKPQDEAETHQPSWHSRTFGIDLVLQPFRWIAMLCRELNPSFIFGVFLVYGLSQGFTGSFFRVVSDYYWKDVQKVQPSAVQMFSGFYYIPWLMKPVWGVLTDAFSVYGYRRRPYFIFSGMILLRRFVLFFLRFYSSFFLVVCLSCQIPAGDSQVQPVPRIR
jgi:Na+/melibiose symporter-like transporter